MNEALIVDAIDHEQNRPIAEVVNLEKGPSESSSQTCAR
jgi:hypothetical protein